MRSFQEALLRQALIVMLLFLTASKISAQPAPAPIDSLVSQYVSNGDFMGTVLVARGGEVLFQKGYGLANIEWDIPNAPDTKFRLGSITKQFTAMLILQLVESGKLKLDGTISEYLPSYPKENGSRVTIHQLLTHTSGIPNYTSMRTFRDLRRTSFTPREFLKVFADSALEFEPGSRYSYSNSGYFVLGAIIEEVTGKPYATVLQERIFDPLGMKSSGYDLPGPIIPNRASGYELGIDGYVNTEYIDMTLPFSAGALYSTVQDLFLWDRALETDRLLSAPMRKRLFEPATRRAGGWYAYGWAVEYRHVGQTGDSVKVVEHGGGINGFNTNILRIPAEGVLVVLLNNTGRAPLGQMTDGILDILDGREPRRPRQSVARALSMEIHKGGLQAGLRRFEVMRADTLSYDLNESEMNSLGYRYLNAARMEEAIALFTLNVQAFPTSSNVYDSLGEAYMRSGNKELAIKNYRTSIELDPSNDNGARMLKILMEK